MPAAGRKPQVVSASGEQAAACDQCEEYLAGWKRALADYDNLKKDLAREKTEMREYVIESFFEKLIPVIDHFDQAMKNVPEESGEIKSWIQGVGHIQKSLIDIANEFGCEPIDPEGEFDPNEHEAISTESREKEPDDNIIEVIERGWRLGDKVIRPAKVIVNKINSNS